MKRHPYSSILIVDDDPCFVEAAGRELSTHRYPYLVREDPDDALRQLGTQTFDLLVICLDVADGVGIDMIENLPQPLALIPIVAVTKHASTASAVACLRAGVADYLEKPVANWIPTVERALEIGRERRALQLTGDSLRGWSTWMRQMLRFIEAGGASIAPPPPRAIHDGVQGYGVNPVEAPLGMLAELSVREQEVLIEIARGHRVGEIGDALSISPHTVRNHFKSIFKKLGVHSRRELLGKLREQRRAEAWPAL